MSLHKAAKDGDISRLRELLAAGADPNLRNKKGQTPLMVAVLADKPMAVKALLDAGADVGAKDRDGATALALAVDCTDSMDMIRHLVNAGAEVDDQGPVVGQTALIRAVMQSDVALVRQLLATGADVNRAGRSGSTSLMEAILASSRVVISCSLEAGFKKFADWLSGEELGDEPQDSTANPEAAEIVDLLIRAGADVNATTSDGFTTLMYAVSACDEANVRPLLAAGADVNTRTRTNGETPLMRAASLAASPTVLQDLLTAGADPNAKDEQGRTAIMHLVHDWHLGPSDAVRTECLQVLLKSGADINAADDEGRTVLVQAVQAREAKAVNALLQAGADAEIGDKHGHTALELTEDAEIESILRKSAKRISRQGVKDKRAFVRAAETGDAAQVRSLLQKGVSPDTRNTVGWTALMLAAMHGHAEVFYALLDAGADAHAKGPCGDTALLHAAGCGNVDMVRRLLQLGADVNVMASGDIEGCNTALANAVARGHTDMVRLLLESGVDVNAQDEEGNTAFMVAATHEQAEMIPLLLAAGAKPDPKADAYLKVTQFEANARRPEYQQVLDRLTELWGRPPTPAEPLKGVYVFVGEDAGPQCAVRSDRPKSPEQAMRQIEQSFEASMGQEQRAREFAEKAGQEVRARGFQLVHSRAFVSGRPIGVLLFPTEDKYAVIAAIGTNCNDGERGPAEIIAWLQRMEKKHPFVLTGCGHDFIEGRFLQPIKNAGRLAEQMYEFCSDIDSVEEYAEKLRRTQRLFLWWD